MPSAVAADLALNVRRIRRNSNLDVVPMLVVEGPADENLWGGLCVHGQDQVFAAGTRDLVEQLLVYLRANPIEGCDCVHLTDCDGVGKKVALQGEAALVVTECCDVEADLVGLGVLHRVIADVGGDWIEPERIVNRAIAIGLRLSIVRRAAARSGISMKRRGKRLALRELSWSEVSEWGAERPSDGAVLDVVQVALAWSDEDRADVEGAMDSTPREFSVSCSGKDVIDAAYRLAADAGVRQFRGADDLDREVSRALRQSDLRNWEVGRRIRGWEAQREGCGILHSS